MIVYPHSLKYLTRKLLLLPLASHIVETLPVLMISSSSSLLRLTQDLYSMSGIYMTLPAISSLLMFISSYIICHSGYKYQENFKIKKKKPQLLLQFFYCVGIALSSRAASSQVLSALMSLTTVFGMGTGGPSSLKTPTYVCAYYALVLISEAIIHKPKRFVNTFFKIFSIFFNFFVGTGKMGGFCAVCIFGGKKLGVE